MSDELIAHRLERQRRRRPPAWYREHAGAEPCGCDAGAETVRRATGVSDSALLLRECPECGARWTGWIEG